MKLNTILDQIDMGSVALPKFQRGYVWRRRQVRKLMRSLYLGYPVGSLLMWETQTEKAEAKGDASLASGTVRLLLDGQQRVTSLYGIIRGKPPTFFDGNENAFLNLYFNLDDEEFEFYGPVKMRDDPRWISVTELMQSGAGNFISRIMEVPSIMEKGRLNDYLHRLNAIDNIKERDFHIEEVSGADKTMDDIVDIFNEVNSGGTKLSKGDLALAKICGSWPEAREEMQARLQKWENVGYHFSKSPLDWLLRCITAMLTSQADFAALFPKDEQGNERFSVPEFQDGLRRAEKHIDYLLELIASRLGLDHSRVLGSPFSFPLLARYIDRQGESVKYQEVQDKLLYWYAHTILWGHYSGAMETTLRRDLVTIDGDEDILEALIANLYQSRGNLRLHPRDFEGATRRSRFYPMLYMMTRVWHSRDFGSGIELKHNLLGGMSRLELHHIFPKARLREYGYHWNEINALANFTFLTKATNLKISAKLAEEYFAVYEDKHPGVLASHWIPMDRELWKIENYRDFLAERRKLLAQAANDFLYQLRNGVMPETTPAESALAREMVSIPGQIADEAEEALLRDAMSWMEQQGLPTGELGFELVEDESGDVLAILDLAWPDGIQVGRTDPAALLIDEGEETLSIAQRAGYRCFTNLEQLQHYVEKEILDRPA